MIDGVHHHAAHMRSSALPTSTPRLAARNVHMIDVANLAYGRETVFVNSANFAGRHFDQRITSLQRGERRLLPCTARNLPPTTRSQFNVVDIGSKRNCA